MKLFERVKEMERRRDMARRNSRRDLLALVVAFALVVIGVWPLGWWRVIAIVAGLYLALEVSERPALRLADEVDLLEKKLGGNDA